MNVDVEEIRPLSPLSHQEIPNQELQMSLPEKSLACHVLMLDILLEQLEVQEVPSNGGLTYIPLVQQCLALLKDMVNVRQNMLHNCTTVDCSLCSLLTSWYHLAQELIAYFSPLHAAAVTDFLDEDSCNDISSMFAGADKSPASAAEKKNNNINDPCKGSGFALDAEAAAALKSGGGVGHDMKIVSAVVSASQVLTAKMETVSELDMAPILPSERVVRAVAKAVTLTEMDVASAKAQIANPTLVSGDDMNALNSNTEMEQGQFWITTAGKFKFSLDELPNHLQLIYGFLKELYHIIRPDTQRHLLRCVQVLSLHCEALSKAAREHAGFLIWVQENLTIAQIWNLLENQTSQVAQTAVPFLLHCLSLPGGSDVFWKIMDSDFHSNEWKIRFSAIERMILVCQFLDLPMIKQSSILQSILSNAFCFLISNMEDGHTAVATKATILLESLHDDAFKLLCWCLEQQFDNFISDRTLLLQSLLALHHHPSLARRKMLSWKFFFNRFDTLFLEAQLILQKTGDCIVDPRDLKNTDINSEAFNKKLLRAKEALRRNVPHHESPTAQPRNLMRSLSLTDNNRKSFRKANASTGLKHPTLPTVQEHNNLQ